ncbi:MAG: DUF4358 domain-containing protein [Ruminococcaceae bacterium]|nr:DUF4358 domain-containing protein [Oscillospiraceae bacterium]
MIKLCINHHYSILELIALRNNVKYYEQFTKGGRSVDKDSITRRRLVLFSVIALVAALAILTGSYFLLNSRREKVAGPSASQITVRIISEQKYTDLMEVNPTQLSKHYNIPEGVISDSSLYMSKSSDNAAELACFLLIDNAKFTQLQAAINQHLTSKAAGYKSLNPAQYNELKNAIIVQNGKYVLVSVGNTTSADEKLFNDILSPNS